MTTFYRYTQAGFRGLIGVARRDITPPVGIYARMWGAAKHDKAEGIHRPLTLTVLTLQQGKRSSAFVLAALDLGFWQSAEDEWFLRGALLKSFKLHPAQVMINLAHTHAGPAITFAYQDKPGGHLIAPYLHKVRRALLEATGQALRSATSDVLTFHSGHCSLARNRDVPDPRRKRIVCGFNPAVPADDTLVVGRVCGKNGRIMATLVNYACHPVTLAWQNKLISPDWVGGLREIVEKETAGAPCLFLQGNSGELAPREQYTADTDVADRHGRQLGYAALSVLEDMLPPASAYVFDRVVESGAALATWKRTAVRPSNQLKAVVERVNLPLKNLPTIKDYTAQLSACRNRILAERILRKLNIRKTLGDGKTAEVPLWVWRVGEAFMIGQMNEAYSALQLNLRKIFSGKMILSFNETNGACGYLPPHALYQEDLYQVWQTPFAAGSLEKVTAAAKNLIEKLS